MKYNNSFRNRAILEPHTASTIVEQVRIVPGKSCAKTKIGHVYVIGIANPGYKMTY